MALIYRAYFSFGSNPRVTSTGLNTSAAYGFTTFVLDLLNREKPTHIGIAFDTSAPTFRHEIFEEYKGHREEMPEGIAVNLPLIRKIIQALNIPILQLEGYEADDIIGTMAIEAESKGFDVYMVTSDKDYAQIVSNHIFLYKPGRQGSGIEILGVEQVTKQWEIQTPKHVADVLALWGDSVDNIPGVPSIGEKTAKKIIGEFGALEKIYENPDVLPEKFKVKLLEHKEKALLCKELATIHTAVPVHFDEQALLLDPPHESDLKNIFQELEFRTLINKVFPKQVDVSTDLFGQPLPVVEEKNQISTSVSSTKNVENFNVSYLTIFSIDEINSAISDVLAEPEFCFDTETDGTDPMLCKLVGFSISANPLKAYYLPLPENEEKTKEILHNLQPLFSSDKLKIGQNLKFDLQILCRYGFSIKPPFFDTMLAHYLLEPDQRHGMDRLAEQYLNYTPISITELIGKKGKGQLSMRMVDIPTITKYACEDADITLQLKQVFEPKLSESGVNNLFYSVEMPLMEVLRKIEANGVKIDTAALADFSDELFNIAQRLEKEIYALAGTTFNIGSPKQLGDVLFDLLKLDAKAKKTATGQYKTDEEVLQKLADAGHEIASKVLEYRSAQKLKSTYVDALPTLINPETGLVHTTYSQAVAATGRLASNNPNLQNIPIRSEMGREVRKAFIPRGEGRVILSADYSQIELRLITEISGEKNMLQAFVNGHDIHQATAAQVYKVELDEVTSDLRRKAKTVNFGIIYGISAFGLSQRLGIPRGEAAELIQRYFETYPGIKEYMEKTLVSARETGYVETVLGRRRYINDINSANATVRGFAERNAINAPIQGSAADMIKIAMINIQNRLEAENFKSQLIMQVHDELVFDAFENELDRLKPLVKSEMEGALKLNVPILVEMGTGKNWLEAH